ncbi:MAG: rhamnose ABC transporter substrate-binding protein [Treponema sp.]|jgi:rhamnose transport system substrate-binding protein|nr:rhamnose ABC transporter substrate-binding protein [Treponema sp.]
MKNRNGKVAAGALVLAAILAGALILSCGGGGQTAAASDTYAIVFKSVGNPYGDRECGGYQEGIEEQGFKCIIQAPAQPNVEGQIQIIEQLIAQKVAAICIVGNDNDALQPVLTKASQAGIKIFSLDSGVNPQSRAVHVNQADSQAIGKTLVEAAYDMCGGSGEFAILSATSQATNQNTWIAFMQETLKDPKYADLTLLPIAYGDDLRDKSTSETEALLLSYPNLKCIVAPTTVGIAAVSKVVTDKGLVGKVKVTGLGLPSEMAEYITNGSCPYMFLWNPIDVGYLGAYVATALVQGKITGAEGDTFSAGRLGEYTIVKAPDGGTEVLLGPPFKFDAANINDWKDVY